MTNISLNTATEIQIAKALGVSRQSVNRRAISEAWGFETTTVRGGAQKKYPLSSLPSDIRMALLSQIDPMTLAGQSTTSEARLQIAEEVEIKTHTPPYNRQSLWAAWDRATATQKERALKALGLLQMVETLVDAGSAKNRTIKEVGGASGINRATFYRWYKMVKGIDKTDWLPVLLPKSRAAGRRKAKCSPEAWEFFKADYLRQEPTTYTDCYERVKAQGKTRGWQIPSLDTLKRRLFKEFDPTTIALLRGGEEALRKMLPAQCRTVSQMHAMQWINGDGYKHNVFVQWEDGSISRPKTWFWQDVYSRRILAWRTDKTENKNTIRLAFGDVLEIGIPLDVTVDNTRAAANKWLTGGVSNRYRFKTNQEDPLGIIPRVGTNVHWTSVFNGKGHGQAKPVERQFGVGGIGEWVDKDPAFAGAYTGPNTLHKPANYGSNAIPIKTFETVLARCMASYNARKGRRTEMGQGIHSFDDVFKESYAKSTIRKATPEQIRMFLMAAESVTIDSDATFTLHAGSAPGISKNRYGSESNVLYRYLGSRVDVRFDPAKLHKSVWVYNTNGQLLCEATCLMDVAFGDVDAAKEWNRKRNAKVRAEKRAAELAKRMTIDEVASRLHETTPKPMEIPKPGITQPMFGAPSIPEKRRMAANGDFVQEDNGQELNVDDTLVGMMGHMRQVIRQRSEKP